MNSRAPVTLRLGLATLGVLAMSAAASVVLTALDDVVGDLGALLWICACFFFPFLIGIAWGPRGRGSVGRAVGALLGGMTAVMPTTAYVLYSGLIAPEISGVFLVIPIELWLVFGLLGMAQGSISLPVGASARKRRQTT